MKTVEKCRHADKYKAIRPSKCGCFVCETKWKLAQLERENVELKSLLKEIQRRSV
jgi:hypothetical protein